MNTHVVKYLFFSKSYQRQVSIVMTHKPTLNPNIKYDVEVVLSPYSYQLERYENRCLLLWRVYFVCCYHELMKRTYSEHLAASQVAST